MEKKIKKINGRKISEEGYVPKAIYDKYIKKEKDKEAELKDKERK